jgi:hypothetical protein
MTYHFPFPFPFIIHFLINDKIPQMANTLQINKILIRTHL